MDIIDVPKDPSSASASSQKAYCGSGPGEHMHRPEVFGTGVHSVPSVVSLLTTQLKSASQRPAAALVAGVSSKGMCMFA